MGHLFCTDYAYNALLFSVWLKTLEKIIMTVTLLIKHYPIQKRCKNSDHPNYC